MMMRKVSTVAVGAVAYLLGAKAGRERYEQITDQARRLWHDPWVQQKTSQAGDMVKDQAPRAGEQLADAAKTAAARVTPGGKDDGSSGEGQPGDGPRQAEHVGVEP
jgi:hypothetical protein